MSNSRWEMSLVMSRMRGALFGAAIGDALGAPYEFSSQPERKWSFDKVQNVSFKPGGPFGLLAGQATDDTHMACCLAASLARNDGLDLDDVAKAYLNWSRISFDVGGLTRGSLREFSVCQDPARSGLLAWEDRNRNAAGNGSLMRTYPIGVFFSRDLEGCLAASMYDSSVTHYDPRCVLACAVYNRVIAYLINCGEWPGVDGILDVALHALEQAVEFWIGNFIGGHEDELISARENIENDLHMSSMHDPDLYNGNGLHLYGAQGFVRVAFRLAFWELFHAPSYIQGISDVVTRGGDADTNGAICGALLGARFGIGEPWEDGVGMNLVDEVMKCNPRAPFDCGGLYHPLMFVDFSNKAFAEVK